MTINFEGFKPWKILRFGGQVDWDDQTQMPNGIALLCQNMKHLAESTRTRDGLRVAMQILSQNGAVTGLDVLKVLGVAGVSAISAIFTDQGVLLTENPPGSGTLEPTALIGDSEPLPTNASMQTAKAANRIIMAFSDLVSSKGPVLQYDAATQGVSPVGQNPIGAAWQQKTFYQTGDLVTPTFNSARWFRRISSGTSPATEPTWPVLDGYYTPTYDWLAAEASENGNAVWEEWKPGATSWLPTPEAPAEIVDNPGGGTIAAGKDIYVAFSYVNDLGESVWTQPVIFSNTAANDAVTVHFQKAGVLSANIVSVQTIPGSGSNTQVIIEFDKNPFTVNQDVLLSGLTTKVALNGVTLHVTFADATHIHGNSTAVGGFYGPAADTGTGTMSLPPIPFGGPRMPRWFATIIGLGTGNTSLNQGLVSTSGIHWPPLQCLNIYVNQVAHGASAPTQYFLLETITADQPVTITAIPPSGTLFTPRTIPTGSFSDKTFVGAPGTRNMILTRQNTVADQAPVDPQAVIPVQFPGSPQVAITSLGREITGQVTALVSDITQFAIGQPITVENVDDSSFDGDVVINSISIGAFPAGFIGWPSGDTTPGESTNGDIAKTTGPCPVAVVPPGNTDFPGYSLDILGFTAVGLGTAGPFNAIDQNDPLNPFSTNIIQEVVGNGDGTAIVTDASGLAAGDYVRIDGWASPNEDLNGPTSLASVNGNSVAFPQEGTFGGAAITGNPTMTVEQILATEQKSGTVGIVLNFDDTSLDDGDDITELLNMIVVPPSVDVAYLPSVHRIAYASDLFPTQVVFSEADFLGEVDGDNNILPIEISNGAVMVGVREMRNGQIVAAKQNAGYAITPNSNPPAQWGVNRLWTEHGPASGRGIATGRAGSSGRDFFVFADPNSGLYVYPNMASGDSTLGWLSEELANDGTWSRVNRAAGAQIWVAVDEVEKEIKIGVPLDGATTPSHILTMNYFNGWDKPLMMTLNGDWIESRTSRRWNIDTIATRSVAVVDRQLVTPIDQRINSRQVLYGMPQQGTEGVNVYFQVPNVFDDVGVGIDSRYRPSFARDEGGRLSLWVGFSGRVRGNQIMNVNPLTDDPAFVKESIQINLGTGTKVKFIAEGYKITAPLLTHEFSNGAKVGAWFELQEIYQWYRPISSSPK